jgi:hypothetical protein
VAGFKPVNDVIKVQFTATLCRSITMKIDKINVYLTLCMSHKERLVVNLAVFLYEL